MSEPTITLTFTPEELSGIYFLSQLGIISSALNSRIKDVVLKNEKDKLDYRAEFLDYKETVMRIREMGGVEKGFNKLDEVRASLNDAYTQMYGKPDEDPEDQS